MGTNINQKDIDIISKKFDGAEKGYSAIQVDEFLDLINEEITQKNNEISCLYDQINALKKSYSDLLTQSKQTEDSFREFKAKFKYIKETDIVNNGSTVNLLKKVNIYEEALAKAGIDPKNLLK